MNLLSPYLAIGKLVALLGALALICWQSSQIHRWHTQSDHCAEARQVDRQSYDNAVRQAQLDNRVQVQKIEQTYKRNSDDERQGYLSDLAKLRAQRVRQAAPAAPGSPGPASPSLDAAAAPRIDASGVCVPATSDVCEAGAEIELRLMHAQNLLLSQSAVDPNK